MKFTVYDIFIILLIIACAAFPIPVAEAVRESALIGIATVVPSLFLLMVLGNMLILMGTAKKIGDRLGGFMTLLKLPKAAFSTYIIGLFAGFPTGALLACEQYKRGELSRDEAGRLVAISNNASFAFIVGVCGAVALENAIYGLILYAACVLSSFAVGFIQALVSKRSERPYTYESANCNFVQALTTSVSNASAACINVVAYITLFGALIRIIEEVSAVLGMKLVEGGFASPLFYGLFEISKGVLSLGELDIEIHIKLILMAVLLGISSMSVLCQIISHTQKVGLSPQPLIAAKLLSAPITAGFAYVMWYFLPQEMMTSGLVFYYPILSPEATIKLIVFYILTTAFVMALTSLICLTFFEK